MQSPAISQKLKSEYGTVEMLEHLSLKKYSEQRHCGKTGQIAQKPYETTSRWGWGRERNLSPLPYTVTNKCQRSEEEEHKTNPF